MYVGALGYGVGQQKRQTLKKTEKKRHCNRPEEAKILVEEELVVSEAKLRREKRDKLTWQCVNVQEQRRTFTSSHAHLL